MSLITEQIKRLKDEADLVECTHDYTAKLLREAADTIKTQSAKIHAYAMERSTAYYNGGWIPVSERLPEKYTYTLWCASSGYVRSDYFNGEFWKDAKKYCYEVIAWMPLPKPYEPQERSGEE